MYGLVVPMFDVSVLLELDIKNFNDPSQIIILMK
jgi:hypothetical protein